MEGRKGCKGRRKKYVDGGREREGDGAKGKKRKRDDVEYI